MYAEMVYQGSRVCDDQKFQQLIGIYVCEKNILLNTNFKRKLFIIVYLYLLFYVCIYNNLKFVNKISKILDLRVKEKLCVYMQNLFKIVSGPK